jgi:sec-independent protein translocase protein TatA
MVPSIGIPELIVVAMILLVVFGGARLPQIGDALGRAARSLKRGFATDDRIAVRAADEGTKLTPPPKATKAADEIADADIVDRKVEHGDRKHDNES